MAAGLAFLSVAAACAGFLLSLPFGFGFAVLAGFALGTTAPILLVLGRFAQFSRTNATPAVERAIVSGRR